VSRLDTILAEARAYLDKGLPDHFAAVRFARVLAAVDNVMSSDTRSALEHVIADLPLDPAPPARDQLDLFGGGS
jgi:hypothetical protein